MMVFRACGLNTVFCCWDCVCLLLSFIASSGKLLKMINYLMALDSAPDRMACGGQFRDNIQHLQYFFGYKADYFPSKTIPKI